MKLVFTITLRQKPRGVSCSRRRLQIKRACSTAPAQNSSGLLPEGFCELVSSKSGNDDF